MHRMLTLIATLMLLGTMTPGTVQAEARPPTPEQSRSTESDATAALERLGGSRIVLKVDEDALRKQILEELRVDARRLLRESRITVASLVVRDMSVEVRIRDDTDPQVVLTKLAGTSVQLPSGAATVDVREADERAIRLTPTQAAVDDRAKTSLSASVDIVKRRVMELRIDAAAVQRDGGDRILVLLPGVKDPARLLTLLESRAYLAFRLVEVGGSLSEAMQGRGSPDVEVLYPAGGKSNLPQLVRREVVMDGSDIADANPGFDRRTGEPVVTFRFNAHGARRFAQVTQENVGRPFAIVLDNEIVSAPIIREPILGGTGQISGNFTVESANNLAILLRGGMLPARLTVVEQQVIEGKSEALPK